MQDAAAELKKMVCSHMLAYACFHRFKAPIEGGRKRCVEKMGYRCCNSPFEKMGYRCSNSPFVNLDQNKDGLKDEFLQLVGTWHGIMEE